ncbi:MAG: hypothetical protein ACOYEV_10900 [Candidatus Nanopelagicales bacterium]
MTSWWLVLGTVLAILIFLWLSGLAGRVDRLNHRIELAEASLDNQLVRRASATESLATSGLLDPATSMVLALAAVSARGIDPADRPSREAVESELTQDLRLSFDDPELVAELRANPAGAALMDDLAAACRRVELSRRFHNDAVAACRQVRAKRPVRSLRLAGSAAYPQTFEMDDAPPPALIN